MTALPWAPASPAADPSYNTKYAFNLDKARALLKESGLSAAEMSDWTLLVDGGDQDALAISQVVQSTLAKVGINIKLDLKQGSEFIDALLGGKFDAVFGGVGNVQKFPTRLATNSIYRTDEQPDPRQPEPVPRLRRGHRPGQHDVRLAGRHPGGLRQSEQGAGASRRSGSPTNTYDIGLIVAAKNVGGITLEIDNMLVARTIGFTS